MLITLTWNIPITRTTWRHIFESADYFHPVKLWHFLIFSLHNFLFVLRFRRYSLCCMFQKRANRNKKKTLLFLKKTLWGLFKDRFSNLIYRKFSIKLPPLGNFFLCCRNLEEKKKHYRWFLFENLYSSESHFNLMPIEVDILTDLKNKTRRTKLLYLELPII